MSQKNMKEKRTLQINSHKHGFAVCQNQSHSLYFSTFNSALNGQIDDDGPTISNFSISTNPWQTDYPFPPYAPTHIEHIKDPCKELIKLQKEYQMKLRYMRGTYNRKGKKAMYKGRTKRKVFDREVLPKYVVDLATGALADPDPFFDGDYDYYYTGGTLCKLFIDDEEHLMRPVSDNQICIQNIRNTKVKIEYMDSPERIYNINSYIGPNDIQNYYTIRHKHKIYLNEMQTKFESKNVFSMELKSDKAPIIDVKYQTGRIAYTDVLHNLHIHDLETGDISSISDLPLEKGSIGSLAQFEFVDENSISYVEGRNVHIIDRRTSEFKSYKPNEVNFSCDHICTISRINHTPTYLYLTTLHNIVKFDLRQMKVVRKWSHLLDSPPIVSKFYDFNGELGWIIGSFDEVILMRMNNSENYLPLKLKTINEVYTKTNLLKKLIISEDLKKRMNLSTVGVEYSYKENKNNKHPGAIYCSNSIGDIYQHNLTDQPSDLPYAMDKMLQWINMLKPIDISLKVTDIVDMSRVKNLINEKPIYDNLELYTTKKNNSSVFKKLRFKCGDHDLKRVWNSDNDDVNVCPEEMVETWLTGMDDEVDME